MKQSQLTIAVVLLAVMVFVVTFAMNYLGGGSTAKPEVEVKPSLELVFANKVHPANELHSVEREEKASGHQDYWFCNTNDKSVKLGLKGKNCKCTNVEAFTLPASVSAKLLSNPKSIDGQDTLAKQLAPAMANPDLEKEATRTPLDKDSDFTTVPPGGVGWVRLLYKGEKPGRQQVAANLWMDDSKLGPNATLQLNMLYLEPLRAQSTVSFGSITEEELTKGITRYIICFSATRSNLPLEVSVVSSKTDPAKNPVVVGKPIPLDAAERAKFKQDLGKSFSETDDVPTPSGEVLSAYRIPVTLNAVSPDGSTPFDLGPFRRRVVISSPEIEGEPKSVVIHGRVRGLIEVGTDEDGGEVNFRGFRRDLGKRLRVSLYSDTPGVKLEVDAARMPEFLKATLESVNDKQAWTLTIDVPPGKASGTFPRRDPIYEDSAVYLKATVPNQPPRSLRIAVHGTATEG